MPVLIISVLACNLPATQAKGPDLAGTITVNNSTLEARRASATPGAGTPSPATEIMVVTAAECRAGPGSSYTVIFTTGAGQTFKLVGQNKAADYWIVESPAGGVCWLRRQDAEVHGDPELLPEYPLPTATAALLAETPSPTKAIETPKPTKATKTPKPSPTPTLTFTATIGVPYTPGVPNFPTYFTASKSCTSTYVAADKYWIEKVELTWQDNADNETGYRIYIAGKGFQPGLGDTLGPNVTNYQFEEQYLDWTLQSQPYESFWVAAFNNVGESIRMGLVLDKCH